MMTANPHRSAVRSSRPAGDARGYVFNVTQKSQKSELLRLCARIGYTPHLRQTSSLTDVPMIHGRRPRTCQPRFPTT